MKTHAPGAALSAVALAASAAAQTPIFQYHIQGLPFCMSPGQTATITILCGFSPGVGGLVTTPIGPRPVLGLSSGSLNIFSSSGSWSGLTLLPPYNAAGTSPGTSQGSNVLGATWGNGAAPPIGSVSTVNPTPIWTGTFTMGFTLPSITVSSVGDHGVWAGNPGQTAVASFSQQVQGAAATMICPAPAGVTAFALAGLLAARRRRSSPCA